VHSTIGTGCLLLVIAAFLGGFGIYAIVRTPPQMLWGRLFVGRVNPGNNWLFNDPEGSEASPAGKLLLRVTGVGLVVGAIVVIVVAIKLL
jgi:hypothetical protein